MADRAVRKEGCLPLIRSLPGFDRIEAGTTSRQKRFEGANDGVVGTDQRVHSLADTRQCGLAISPAMV
jgi:hypothetical protein